MATATASFSFVLNPVSTRQYVWLSGTQATGTNTIKYYQSAATAGDQIEFSISATSGVSVSSNGSFVVTGATSNFAFAYRRWSDLSDQWGTTATAVYYPNNANIAVGVGDLRFGGNQPDSYRDYKVAPGAGGIVVGGVQQLIAGQLSNYTASLSMVLSPDASHSYVVLTSISSGPGFLSASPGLVVGSQIEYEKYLQSSGGTTGKLVYVRADGSFYTDTISALQVITFNWRVHQSGSWSNTATATVDLGGEYSIYVPNEGAVTFTGNQPTVRLDGLIHTIGNPAGITFDGYAPEIGIGKTIAIGAGSITFSGQAISSYPQQIGSAGISFVGLQPTVTFEAAPPVNPGFGLAPGDLLFIGEPVGVQIRGVYDISGATITFTGYQPTIVTMGNWTTTAAYSLSWSN